MRLLKVLFASIFVSSAAVAGEVNSLQYGSISVAYTYQTLKFTDGGEELKFDALKGPAVTAETLVADRFLLGLTYGQIKSSNISVDGVASNPAVKTKLSPAFALIGYRFETGKGVDVIPFVEHRRFKTSLSGGANESSSNSDTAVGVQLRTALSPSVELHLNIDRDDVKTNSISGRTLYKFDKNWAVFLSHARQSGKDNLRVVATTLGASYLF